MASLTPRRSTRIQEKSPGGTLPTVTPDEPAKIDIATSTDVQKQMSPLQPSSMEAILLALYPATLVLGSLFSLLNRDARGSAYDPISQAHEPGQAPSYFAQKTNLFNLMFVKRGWFWITASYILLLFTNKTMGTPYTFTFTTKRIRGITRWAIVTLWWIFVTQWFFGPPIVDRGFTLTGGACELVLANENGEKDLSRSEKFVTGMACKAMGGKWHGGHDISGHVFLLVLGSMFLLEELLHIILTTPSWREERNILMQNGAVKKATIESEATNLKGERNDGQWDLAVKVGLGISGLSFWMLLMTAVYFHTWFEKLTGLLVALSGIFVVYFLPRIVPAWRAVVGLPGI